MTPTEYYLTYFNSPTPPVLGYHLSQMWEQFEPIERRCISYLNDSYSDWRQCLMSTEEDKKRTFLQEFSLSVNITFDYFLHFLLEELSDEDELSSSLKILKGLNQDGYVENPDFRSGHERNLTEGINQIGGKSGGTEQDAFEIACYFFTLAFNYLSSPGREVEYNNAMLEAFEHIGEFRGWYSYKRKLEKQAKRQKDAKKAANVKSDKDFGPQKAEVTRQLKEDIRNNNICYKTQKALHEALAEHLDDYCKENNLKESADTVALIKGWARQGDFKKLFDEVYNASKENMSKN